MGLEETEASNNCWRSPAAIEPTEDSVEVLSGSARTKYKPVVDRRNKEEENMQELRPGIVARESPASEDRSR
jgi:hypothetical protein